MVEIEITEKSPPPVENTDYGLYKTPDGHYYWHFYTSFGTDINCVWLTRNSSTGEHNGFKRTARSRRHEDVKVAGEVKLTFTL